LHESASAIPMLSAPIRASLDCSPRATSGHTVVEPATILMKSRRLMSAPMVSTRHRSCSNEDAKDINRSLRFGPSSFTLHPGDRRQDRRRGERRVGPDDDGLALRTAPIFAQIRVSPYRSDDIDARVPSVCAANAADQPRPQAGGCIRWLEGVPQDTFTRSDCGTPLRYLATKSLASISIPAMFFLKASEFTKPTYFASVLKFTADSSTTFPSGSR